MLDHVGRSPIIVDDILERIANLRDVGGSARGEETPGRQGVIHDCRKGLMDFMRYRGGKLADSCQPADLGQFFPLLPPHLLGLLALRDIPGQMDGPLHLAVFAYDRNSRDRKVVFHAGAVMVNVFHRRLLPCFQ